MFKIEVDHDAKDADIKVIQDGMTASTEDTLGGVDFKEKSFSVYLKTENNKILGGILARFDLESVYIDLLWVDEKERHQGHGSTLLKVAEEEARKLGCRYSTVDTWSFQAEQFYLKNGYFQLGEIKNYWLHHSKIFLRKELK